MALFCCLLSEVAFCFYFLTKGVIFISFGNLSWKSRFCVVWQFSKLPKKGHDVHPYKAYQNSPKITPKNSQPLAKFPVILWKIWNTYEPNWPRRLGCGGGGIYFGSPTSCNPRTSVESRYVKYSLDKHHTMPTKFSWS